jgi:translation initiation factor 2 gamma subunit (eIF-2gamma)
MITEPNGIVTAIASNQCILFRNNTGAVSVLASGNRNIDVFLGYTDANFVKCNRITSGTYLTVTDANNCAKVQTVNYYFNPTILL